MADNNSKKRNITLDDDARGIYDNWGSHGEKAKNASEAFKLYDRLLKEKKESISNLCISEFQKWINDDKSKQEILTAVFANCEELLARKLKDIIKRHESKYHSKD